MEISEVRVKLVENPSERLQAFCSITLDGDFVIRDLKVIEGTNGAFVAMPSRKLADRCSRCGCKNQLRAKFCNDCGNRLDENRAPKDAHGRAKLHADVAHPINAACRERIQKAVIEAYHAEKEAAKSPDYKPKSLDDYDDDFDIEHEEPQPVSQRTPVKPRPQAPPTREAAPTEALPDGDEVGSDYDSLIADLKREASQRHERQPGGGPARPPQRQAFRPPQRRDDSADQRRTAPPRREEPAEQPAAMEPAPKPQTATPPKPKPVVAAPPPPPPPAPAPVRQETNDDFGAGLI